MSNFEKFSMEQSEELIAQLKTNSPSGFTQLHSSLKLLSHVSAPSPVAMPPLLPSAVDQPIESITLLRPRAHRSVITSLIITAVLASASFAAAGVTGRGPAVIVEAAQKSGEIVSTVVGTIGKTLTGKNDDAKPPIGIVKSASSDAEPVNSGPEGSVSSPEGEQIPSSNDSSHGGDQNSNQSSSQDGNNSEGPSVKADPSATPSAVRPNIRGLGTLVLSPASNPQSGEDSHESDNDSD